jgi:hypothetical protein
MDRLDAEVQPRDRIEVVARRGAVQHVRLEHRVVAHAAQFDAVVAQHVRVVLEMVAELGAMLVGEQRPQEPQDFVAVQLVRRARVSVRERHVGRATRFDRERDADDFACM